MILLTHIALHLVLSSPLVHVSTHKVTTTVRNFHFDSFESSTMNGLSNIIPGNLLGEDPNIIKNKNDDDHTRVRANKYKAQAAAGVRPNVEAVEELPDYVDSVSKMVDENLFEPYFVKHSGVFERNLYENMTDLRSIRKIDNNLRFTKVAAIVGCAFSGGLLIKSCASGSPAFAIIYGIMSADFLRISYNCYIKNYCAIALKKLGSDGNPAKIGAAVFQWYRTNLEITINPHCSVITTVARF
jgi:hypothetical protein